MRALLAAVLCAATFALPASAVARPAPAATMTVVDETGGGLPAATAAAAWSKNTNVRLVVAPACGVDPCYTIRWDDTLYCASLYGSGVVGCAQDTAAGCTVRIDPGGPVWFRLRAVTHELGHCLGLPHNLTDRRSIMAPSPTVDAPNAGDRADVRALYPS